MDGQRTRALLIAIGVVAIVTLLGLVVLVIKWSGVPEPSRRTDAATSVHAGPDPVAKAQAMQSAINSANPPRQGETITSVHAGPDPVANGRALQTAINNANPGDTLLLDAGGN